jgi:hypothetical protein
MPTLGRFEYPGFPLSDSVALGQRIAREFAGEISRRGVASALGMSARGGAFSARLGALRQWGVATGRSRVRVTRDGLRASTPLSVQEAESARRTLARSVPLFVQLSARLGNGPYDTARLAVLLEEITGAGRQQIAPRLAAIDRVFSEVRGYLAAESTRDSAQAAPAATTTQPPGQPTSPVPQGPPAPPVFPAAAPSLSPVAPGPTLANSPVPATGRPDQPETAAPRRVELLLPDGAMSLAETLANLDAMLAVLWAHRQLVAARQAAEANPVNTPGPASPDLLPSREPSSAPGGGTITPLDTSPERSQV